MELFLRLSATMIARAPPTVIGVAIAAVSPACKHSVAKWVRQEVSHFFGQVLSK